MEQKNTLLSPEEFVEEIGKGGWSVLLSHDFAHELNSSTFLYNLKASLLGDALVIESGDYIFEVPAKIIVRINPWFVEIRHVIMRSQQRKKKDGGGWHDVPVIEPALKLVNLDRQAKAVEDYQKQVTLKEEDRKRREAEAYEALRKAFVEKLNGEYAGKTITKVDIVDRGLEFEIVGGQKLSIQLAGGDIWDAWINVNGVSVESFKEGWC